MLQCVATELASNNYSLATYTDCRMTESLFKVTESIIHIFKQLSSVPKMIVPKMIGFVPDFMGLMGLNFSNHFIAVSFK